MSEVSFTKRRHWEGKVWGCCDECDDGEYFPVAEHRRFHELYDLIDGHVRSLRCIADELMPMLKNDKKFTYFAEEKTQGGIKTFSLHFTQIGRLGSAMFLDEAKAKATATTTKSQEGDGGTVG